MRPVAAHPVRGSVKAALCLAFALGLAAWALAAPAAACTRQVLAFSDVHFTPFADSSLVDQLVAADYTAWQAVLEKGDRNVATYGQETNYALLASSLDQMAAYVPQPAFVLMTGDILAHNFRAHYLAAEPGASESEIRSFIQKTVAFFAGQIHQRFPDSSVYFTLGNNDSYRGDYMIEPNGQFLSDASAIFSEYFINDASQRSAFTETFSQAGMYNLPAPDGLPFRIIAMNSILFSHEYQPPDGDSTDYQGQQLAWLETQLAAARAAGKRVWLLEHIPAGLDTYSTVHNPANNLEHMVETTPLWKQTAVNDYTKRFTALLSNYADTLTTAFAGHTHMDDFRLVNAGETLAGGQVEVHITPGISPQFGNNPGYHVFSFEPDSGALVDYEARYLDVADAASKAQGWRSEYRFASAYNLYGGYDEESLKKLVRLLWTDPAARAAFYARYEVSDTTSPLKAGEFPAYLLGSTELGTARWAEVYNGAWPFGSGAFLPADAVGDGGITIP